MSRLIATLLLIALFDYSQSRNTNSPFSSAAVSRDDAQTRSCEFGIKDCGLNEECVPKRGYSNTIQGACECAKNFLRQEDGKCVRRHEPKEDTTYVPTVCEYGVEFCGTNEICQPKNRRSKNGLCVCKEGYKRSGTGSCEPEVSSSTEKQVTTAIVSIGTLAELAADAGSDVTIDDPETLVVLEGGARSHSNVVRYSWHRAESSLSSGLILNSSDQQKKLLFVPTVSGLYEFVLTVQSEDGAIAHDNVRITVLDKAGQDAIVLRLAGAAYRFSEADQHGLETQIELLLGKPSAAAQVRPHVSISRLTEQISDSSLLVEFDVHFQVFDGSFHNAGDSVIGMWTNSESSTDSAAALDDAQQVGLGKFHSGDARWVVAYLEEKLEEQRNRLLDFDVLSVGAKYCIDGKSSNSATSNTTNNRCGAHAKCVDERRCVCEPLWLASPTHHLRLHCDWSLLVVVLVPLALLLVLVVLLAAIVRLCPRRRSLEERVRARLARREHGRREAKRLLSDEEVQNPFDGHATINNLFDSDDNYEAGVDTDEEKAGPARARGAKACRMNKLTTDAADLRDAEVTAFVNDNVNVNVKSGMNLSTQKTSKAKA